MTIFNPIQANLSISCMYSTIDSNCSCTVLSVGREPLPIRSSAQRGQLSKDTQISLSVPTVGLMALAFCRKTSDSITKQAESAVQLTSGLASSLRTV